MGGADSQGSDSVGTAAALKREWAKTTKRAGNSLLFKIGLLSYSKLDGAAEQHASIQRVGISGCQA